MPLHCKDVGHGPAIVLIHGFPLDGRMWAYQEVALSLTHRLLVPDLRGFGRSAPGEGGVQRVDDMADEVLAAIESRGVMGPLVVGGLSMGGYVALSLAIRFPTRVRALLLMDTKAAGDTPDAAMNRLKLASQVEQSGAVDAVIQVMVPRLFAAETLENRQRIEPIEAMMRGVPPQVYAAVLRGLAERPDRTADLAGIAVPTLVVVGQEDAISPPAEARAMAAALPRATLAVIEHSGHMSPWENPTDVNLALTEFLAQLV